MIWSVSMLAPNFHARPRITFARVTELNPRRELLSGESSDACGHLFEHLSRVGDDSGYRARGGHRRVGQVDHRLRVAHPAWKVAIGRAQAHLTLAQHAHVATEAGAAGGRRPRRPGGERSEE